MTSSPITPTGGTIVIKTAWMSAAVLAAAMMLTPQAASAATDAGTIS
jgi:hypothetical protein